MPQLTDQNLHPEVPIKKMRWEQFCLEYIKDGNASEAAVRSGFKQSHNRHLGSKLSNSNYLKPRIEYLQQQKLEKVEVTVDWILKQLKDIANGREKTADKIRALDLLGRHLAMFTDKVKHEGLPKRIIIRNETSKVEEELS